ncbi:hypothetical protein SAMN05421813_105134 [Daejeonella rubra]|uniref:Uncharacterized protein n=1 Tax=Daejeonella rubra TaxID=990371 RepID=A0A1G9Q5Z6_9SPHI|nr:hypothetical protein [Daejeonella rubra]SDM06389.1 hypothetical protein SAMN05421813_105134 [Daejeonella rubra]
MNAEQNWKQMNYLQDNDLSSLLNIPAIGGVHSNNPLKMIRRSFFYNMMWATFFNCLYLVLFFIIDFWQIKAGIIILLIVHIWGILSAFKQYKSINLSISADQSVLEVLKAQHNSVKLWTKTHLRMGLLIYPFSITGSFILGGALGSSKSIEAFMARPYMLLILIVLLVVFIPACHYLAKILVKHSFGKHLILLQKNIADLESEEF